MHFRSDSWSGNIRCGSKQITSRTSNNSACLLFCGFWFFQPTPFFVSCHCPLFCAIILTSTMLDSNSTSAMQPSMTRGWMKGRAKSLKWLSLKCLLINLDDSSVHLSVINLVWTWTLSHILKICFFYISWCLFFFMYPGICFLCNCRGESWAKVVMRRQKSRSLDNSESCPPPCSLTSDF